MNMKERIYMMLRETMSQPIERNCQWREKLEDQVYADGKEKAYCHNVVLTERSNYEVKFR